MWLGVDGVGYIERMRLTINDPNYAAASRLSRSLVGSMSVWVVLLSNAASRNRRQFANRINFVLGDADRNIRDHVSPMLTVYLYPDGSLMTYEGSAGERVLPIAWLDRCRQIKDGLVTPAPVHVESTMPDAHRVAPLDDAADLGL